MEDLTFTIRRSWLRRAFIVAVVFAVMVPVAVSAAGGAFTDDDDSIFEANIEWLADAGVTLGCNPPTNDNFCPGDNVNRGQMAAFMYRFAEYLGALDGTPANADNATNADNADTLDGMDSSDFLPAVVPAGETIYGTIGAQDYAAGAGQELMGNASLPIPAPVGLVDGTVTVAGGVDDTDGNCTGTSEEPTAAPGHVCIYSFSALNTVNPGGGIWGSGDGTKWGFQLSVLSLAAGRFFWVGNWAYTAPTEAPVRLGTDAPTPGVAGE